MIYNILTLSDIHFGAFDSDILYNELNDIFVKYLKLHAKNIDILVITGDYFHKKLNMSSEHAKYALTFFSKICNICSKHNIKLRIIQGTLSHDNNQLDILRINADDISSCDIKFIYNVCDEQIFDDLNVLYIPEEYIDNKDDYYKDYFNKSYDIVFGHGLFKDVSFCALMQESATTMKKAPTFDIDDFDVNGPIIFGHIHKPQVIQHKLLYVGSFSRWSFGESESKGFYHVTYNTKTFDYDFKFIENTKCRKFDTIEILGSENFFLKKIDEQIEYVNTLISYTDSYRVRVIISIPPGYENEKMFTKMMIEYYNNYKNVKLVINSVDKSRVKKDIEEKVNKLLSKYEFIFNKTIPYEMKISQYIKIKYGIDIPTEYIQKLIYK